MRRAGTVIRAAVVLATVVGLARYRRWHLAWGATPAEAGGPMPGDALLPGAQFRATRAITIAAPPASVWPWLVQVGFGRAGFYSYDLLDNLGRPSTTAVLPAWQHPRPGDLAAPMTHPPTPATSFVVQSVAENEHLVWAKPDSTWAWRLTPLDGGRTRLVTRLKARYRLTPALPVTVGLMELADFPMMRRMLRGIRFRAERRDGSGANQPQPALRSPNGTSGPG